MDSWRDAIHWIDGLPFEVAMPEEIFDYHRLHGFILKRLKTGTGGIECNGCVFDRSAGQ